MAIDFEKVCGWLLLFAGLALIVYSVRTSYGYFTKQAPFPALIEMSVAAKNEPSIPNNANIDLTNPQAVQELMRVQVQSSVDRTIGSMVPNSSIVSLLNAAIWSIFAMFLVYAGAKISEIGIKLLKSRPQN